MATLSNMQASNLLGRHILRPVPFRRIVSPRNNVSGSPRRVCSLRVCAASTDTGLSTPQTAALVLGAVFNPVVLLSEYTLVATGQGLDPGPGGLYGAAEGIGFLVVPGIVGYSIYSKVKTGGGLPAGPAGLLGAVEGVSWLTTALGIAAFAYTYATKGALPGVTGG